jgi:hypothetical protein
MPARRKPRRRLSQAAPGGYLLIARGPDGRTRIERFNDASSYRDRLLALRRSAAGGLSIDDLAGMLDETGS